MKIKKLASLLIACAMVLGMAMPAFANDFGFDTGTGTGTGTGSDTSNSNAASSAADPLASPTRSLNFVGTTSAPTIKVTLSNSAGIVLNPFGLKIGSDDVTDPFISDTVYLTNESDCKIAVSGSLTPTVTGNTKLVDSPEKAATGTDAKLAPNNVFVCASIGKVSAADTVIDFADGLKVFASSTDTTGTAASTYKDKMLGKAAAADKTTDAAKFQKNVDTASDNGVYILKAADTAVKFGDSADATKGPSARQKLPYLMDAGNENAQYIGIRLFGLCESKVTTPWTADDTVSVAMALTLVPTAN